MPVSDKYQRAAEFAALWAWREEPANASAKLTDSERLSVIKYHPDILSIWEGGSALAHDEAVAWRAEQMEGGEYTRKFTAMKLIAEIWQDQGFTVTPLYTHPAPQPSGPVQVGIVTELLFKAEAQKAYWNVTQRALPSIEDYLDEHGELSLPADISPLLQQASANGRYSEADWWLSTLSAIAQAPAPVERIEDYYARQIEWSRNTFGPGTRTAGVIDHIRKELIEIETEPTDLSEWIDVVILAMDGFWRHGGSAKDLMPRLLAKQRKNFARKWPDWRTMSEDEAIEHDRSGEAPAPVVADGWQPIETGPKDKTRVIIAVPTKDKDDFIVGEAYFDPDNYEGGDWWWANTMVGGWPDDPISEINYHAPTHWMPLPAAPSALSPHPASKADELAAARAEIERLQKGLDWWTGYAERLREAVEPFTRYRTADGVHGLPTLRVHDDHPILWGSDLEPVVTVGDFRRARAILNTNAKGGER
ncbi:hypothetical protein GCM10011491_30240 [Brucella endophytica]|uniref:DUF550 domain-containing protein n=1 Tax=Brucella endophytica TaxID=1963359 RepID=A0A916SH59_9HYPH|nr:dATP/dGTP pyrophosphohydrolase domain-containing protein [Brucella endophytica]GGA99938.1 hypothetical protein GCM10011491_30240 [Brucella endophytica]